MPRDVRARSQLGNLHIHRKNETKDSLQRVGLREEAHTCTRGRCYGWSDGVRHVFPETAEPACSDHTTPRYSVRFKQHVFLDPQKKRIYSLD